MTTIRQSSIDQLSFAAILANAQSTPGIVSEDVGPSILDIPTETVTRVPTFPLAGTAISREIVDISVPTGLPLRVWDTKETLSSQNRLLQHNLAAAASELLIEYLRNVARYP